MALDYRKCAEEIFSHLGGKENIASAAHCATRLRLAIVDNSKVDVAALEETEGVQGVFNSNGQLQLIIGTGTVNKVYDEFLDVTGLTAASKDDVKKAAAANMPLPKRMIKSLGDVFVPILPAIVASGLLMGVVEALGKAIPGFSATDWYSFLDMVANTAFAYLPVLVAISAARVFGGNIFLGAVVGLAMIHSALTNGWNAANGYDVWYLFGHIQIGSYTLGQINVLGYQGHVIPVMIAVFLMCKIENYLHKKVPEMIDLFVTPITTVFLTLLITFTIVGPIFSAAETAILTFAKWLITVGYGIGALAMGALYPFTVVMGLHHMYNVIEAGMLSSSEFGNLNIWMPIASAANFAQFGACLAVGLKTRNAKTKGVAIPSSLSAALGITEPAIFGVNMRFTKPFICGAIGGAIGAMFGSWVGLGATSYGITGIPGYLIINKPLLYTILLAISGGIAFVLTTIIWKEEVQEKPLDAVVLSCDKGEVIQPVYGEVIPASEIEDAVFAQETMGPSVGIRPKKGEVYAPFDGEVAMVFPTNHAIGLKSEGGIELLIHIGVDTVNMNGDGFTSFVQAGDKVKKGDQLISFDLKKIKAANHPDTTIVAITNGFDVKDVKKIK